MVGIMMVKKQTASHWWWLDSHNNAKRSPWLQSTLSELDQRTEAMLKLIEEDADSFAKRAEMYYKKRPELIGMVQDFYKAHRSLAERYDQIKSETPARLLTTLGSPFSGEKSYQEKPVVTPISDRSYDSYSDTFEHDEHAESEVEDPDEDNKFDGPEAETPRTPIKRENAHDTRIGRMAVLADREQEEVRKLREEIERLRKENRAQREELAQKDEEKREVIRQLSMAVGLLKEENASLRKSANKENKKKDSSEVNSNNGRVKGGFLRKLFNVSFLSSSQATVVAL